MQAGTSFFSDVPALFLKNHKRFHLTREFRKPLRGQPEPAFLFFDRNVLPLFMQYNRVFDTPDPQKADKALFFVTLLGNHSIIFRFVLRAFTLLSSPLHDSCSHTFSNLTTSLFCQANPHYFALDLSYFMVTGTKPLQHQESHAPPEKLS